MAIEDIATRAASYGFPGFTVDGMDFIQCYESTRLGIKRAREQGPVLLEMKVERFMPHTTDDDDRRYRPREEMEAIRQRDPVETLGELLITQSILTEQQIEDIKAQARDAVDEATDVAEAAAPPDASDLLKRVYAP